jgi:hypothetical protein
MITLTSYSQRREIRETIQRLLSLYAQHCFCGGPQPSYDDLKLEQHTTDCKFVNLFEGKESLCSLTN